MENGATRGIIVTAGRKVAETVTSWSEVNKKEGVRRIATSDIYTGGTGRDNCGHSLGRFGKGRMNLVVARNNISCDTLCSLRPPTTVLQVVRFVHGLVKSLMTAVPASTKIATNESASASNMAFPARLNHTSTSNPDASHMHGLVATSQPTHAVKTRIGDWTRRE